MGWGEKAGSTEVGWDKGQVYVTVTGTTNIFLVSWISLTQVLNTFLKRENKPDF